MLQIPDWEDSPDLGLYSKQTSSKPSLLSRLHISPAPTSSDKQKKKKKAKNSLPQEKGGEEERKNRDSANRREHDTDTFKHMHPRGSAHPAAKDAKGISSSVASPLLAKKSPSHPNGKQKQTPPPLQHSVEPKLGSKRKNMSSTPQQSEMHSKRPDPVILQSTPPSKTMREGSDSPQVMPRGKKKKNDRTAEKRLEGARFRMLNETLYTSTGAHAFDLFSSNPDLFDVYHKGFQTQVEMWPSNPLDRMIRELSRMSKDLVVADLGCGEGRLATCVPQKVHSFDLVADSEHVVACDIAHLPLESKSVDVAIFCLSLMGVNYCDFLIEANRVLKNNGLLKIAEVKSRIPNLEEFIALVESMGFHHAEEDTANTMFVMLDFKKAKKDRALTAPSIEEASRLLLPCIYKRR